MTGKAVARIAKRPLIPAFPRTEKEKIPPTLRRAVACRSARMTGGDACLF